MAVASQTFQEAINHILKRGGVESSEEYEDILITILNDAFIFVAALHDWEYLRKYTTVTTADATGVVNMPADFDRVLGFQVLNSEYPLLKVQPSDFMAAKRDSNMTEPRVFCVYGYTQSGDTTIHPLQQVEIHTAPTTGVTLQLWYIKVIDELIDTSTSLDDVPNIPFHIWDLVKRKSTIELLKMQEASATTINQEERHLLQFISIYKGREDKGSARRSSFAQNSMVYTHYRTRKR
jgi:hypothetical protein